MALATVQGYLKRKTSPVITVGKSSSSSGPGVAQKSDTCGNDKAGGNTESDSGSVQGISGSGKPEHGEQLDGFRQ